jgi:exopolyphosphatase/guanosine-5'-triphosphate,3'-diphosphate pyrophosphatase
MAVSKAALREGVLYDMLGRGGVDDPRDASVTALMQRYGIDAAQARRVEATVLQLFDQVAAAWQLDADDRHMLSRAARLHEVGLAIAHSGYHVHGAYILEHSDIAGFSQQEQRFLAALVRTHRRGIPKSAFEMIPDRLLGNARRSAALLRIAVLLHRSHDNERMPMPALQADGGTLSLTLDKRWLQARPLLRADFEGEPEDMLGLGVQLRLATD